LSAKRISLYLTATDFFLNSVGAWHLQGMVFSPIPFQPDALPPVREPPGAEQPESSEDVPAASVTSTMSEFFRRMIFPPQEVSWITVSEPLYFGLLQCAPKFLFIHPLRLAHLNHFCVHLEVGGILFIFL
jgi:hypothetical protein